MPETSDNAKRGLPYILAQTSKSLPTSDFYKTKNQVGGQK